MIKLGAPNIRNYAVNMSILYESFYVFIYFAFCSTINLNT